MNKRLRYLLFAFSIGLLLLLTLLFRQFVLAGILLPAATAVWLILRIFVLSIHQQVIWWGVIFLSAIMAIRGFYRRSAVDFRIPPSDSNPEVDRVSTWRESIRLNVRAAVGEDLFRRDLMWLFTSLYSSRQQGEAKYKIREAILNRQIPLPRIHLCLPAPPRIPPAGSRCALPALSAAWSCAALPDSAFV